MRSFVMTMVMAVGVLAGEKSAEALRQDRGLSRIDRIPSACLREGVIRFTCPLLTLPVRLPRRQEAIASERRVVSR